MLTERRFSEKERGLIKENANSVNRSTGMQANIAGMQEQNGQWIAYPMEFSIHL